MNGSAPLSSMAAATATVVGETVDPTTASVVGAATAAVVDVAVATVVVVVVMVVVVTGSGFCPLIAPYDGRPSANTAWAVVRRNWSSAISSMPPCATAALYAALS